MKKHFKVVVALVLAISIMVCDWSPAYAGDHTQTTNPVVDTWNRYYNWLVDLNYRKTEFVQQNLRKQYLNVRNWLINATRIFTNEPFSGSHGGGGHSRDGAVVITEDPVTNPQPIYKNYDNSVYNPVTNNYETIDYIYEDYSYNDNSTNVISYETTNNFITYEFNYTYYDIVVSPKESPTEGKFFKVYYQLPDGRSSFNLTPDDIKGVIFNYDVVNYERTVTDADVIGIWHLDGDCINSVNNYDSAGIWNNNFVDGRFDGCLLRDGSYTFNSDPSSSSKNFNNIYLTTPLSSMPSEWTLEFWVWVPDPSTTLWQDNSGNYHRSKPLPLVFNSAPSWVSIAVQSDGTYYVNGVKHNATPFWQLSYARNANGWPDKFLSIYQLGNFLNIWFSYSSASVAVVENGVTYYYDTMATFAIDEIKFTKRLLYTSDFIPRSEPFDLTFAYTVPDLNLEYSTIAIQSPVAVHSSQIGGVRSPNPSVGDVFISLYEGRATSISQYYNGIWNTVDGAVYFNGSWHDLLSYDFNKMMLVDTDTANTGATYIYNTYIGDSYNYVDISGDDITITVDTTDANPQDVAKILLWIPLLFGAVGTILGAICPFLPAWLTGLIALCLGAVVTLILFVFIRRK